MATCEEIRRAARTICENKSGSLVLSPPVRMLRSIDQSCVGVWRLDPDKQAVRLVGESGDFPISDYTVSHDQGRKKGEVISNALWDELEELLNSVANEREDDRNGPGTYPTWNARDARDMLDKLWMERRKPSHII